MQDSAKPQRGTMFRRQPRKQTPPRQTPPRRQELLLGAVALLGAAAALVALGARSMLAPAVQPPQVSAGYTGAVLDASASALADAAQPTAPAQWQEQAAVGYTGVVVYYTAASGAQSFNQDQLSENAPANAAQPTAAPQAGDTNAAPGSSPGASANAQPTAPPQAAQYPVNLNTATQAQLETLPGIGAVKAQAILAWRAAHGGFVNVNQLLEINGIGEKTLQNLLPYIIL